MKRFWAFLPHLCVSLLTALAVVLILDAYNPILELVRGVPFLALAGLAVVSGLALSIRQIARQRKADLPLRAFYKALKKYPPVR